MRGKKLQQRSCASQYAEFSEFVKQHSSPTRLAILKGDFNTLGDKAQLDDQNSAYHLLTGKLREAQAESKFSDLWIDHGKGPGGTSEQVIEDGGRRIDYIFLLNPAPAGSFKLETQKISVNRFLDPKVIALSDHSAVEATLGIPKRLLKKEGRAAFGLQRKTAEHLQRC